MISQAAYRKICVQFRVAAIAVARVRFFERYTCIALLFLCFASAAPATILSITAANSIPDSQNYLFVATLDNVTGEMHFEEHPDAPQQPQAADQPPLVIERIDFIGNRRIRTDTLKARIFSREGDPYNEETLRRY